MEVRSSEAESGGDIITDRRNDGNRNNWLMLVSSCESRIRCKLFFLIKRQHTITIYFNHSPQSTSSPKKKSRSLAITSTWFGGDRDDGDNTSTVNRVKMKVEIISFPCFDILHTISGYASISHPLKLYVRWSPAVSCICTILIAFVINLKSNAKYVSIECEIRQRGVGNFLFTYCDWSRRWNWRQTKIIYSNRKWISID